MALALGVVCSTACTAEGEWDAREPQAWLGEETDSGTDGDELARGEVELSGLAVDELVEVEDGVSLPVPPRGESVFVTIAYEDGDALEVGLSHDEDGRVRVEYPDEPRFTSGPASTASCPSKCSDSDYSFVFSPRARWYETLQWYYNDWQSPLPQGEAAAALWYGASGIAQARNACGLSDEVWAQQWYRGNTHFSPAVGVHDWQVTCWHDELNDGVNVVGWGWLPDGVLGVACTRVKSGQWGPTIVASDQRYNTQVEWFTGDMAPAGCSNAYSLRAVATHEFGHSFGLGHSRCSQTMSPHATPCSSDASALGRGDVVGLEALYD